MASDCEGLWLNSKINGNEDGEIELIEVVPGLLAGTHFQSQNLIVGTCREGTPPHIQLTRMDGIGFIYVYEGDITRKANPDRFVIEGNAVRIAGPFGLSPKELRPAAGDDWTAEKPT